MVFVKVRVCERCDGWDTADNRVLKVGVCGPRMDLCGDCRVAVMMEAGLPHEDAVAYSQQQEDKANAKDDDAEQTADTESGSDAEPPKRKRGRPKKVTTDDNEAELSPSGTVS